MGAPEDFNPLSMNAMFATILANQQSMERTILARLDRQDVTSERIEKQTNETNGRVLKLETWRRTQKAKVATAAILISSAGSILFWLGNLLFGHSSG